MKIIKIKDCLGCPYYKYILKPKCKILDKEIKKNHKILKDCPLEDCKNDD